MDLDFTEEHGILRDMVRALCAEHATVEVVRAFENDARGYPDGLWKQLSEQGLVGILIPESHGGGGQTLLEAAILHEELGRALAPTPHLESAVLAAGAIARAGSAEQKSAWLPRIASGEAVLTPAWLEPKSSFAAKGVQLRAVKDGDAFDLSGTKLHVTFARAAERLVVLARVGDGETDIDLFLVDPQAKGVTLSQRQNLGSQSVYRIDFENVRVAAKDRIGAAGTGWATWQDVMLDGCVLAAAQAAGGGRRERAKWSLAAAGSPPSRAHTPSWKWYFPTSCIATNTVVRAVTTWFSRRTASKARWAARSGPPTTETTGHRNASGERRPIRSFRATASRLANSWPSSSSLACRAAG